MLEKCCITFKAQPDRIARCSCSTLLGRHRYCRQLESCFASSLVGIVQRNRTFTMPRHHNVHRNCSLHCLNHLLQLSGEFFTIADVNSLVNVRVAEVTEPHLALWSSLLDLFRLLGEDSDFAEHITSEMDVPGMTFPDRIIWVWSAPNITLLSTANWV